MEELIFKNWCRASWTSAEDFETYADWEAYERDMKEIIHDLLVFPVRDAFTMAEKKGWLWKRYREVVAIVALYR